MTSKLTRELFVEEFGHRIDANVRDLDVDHNKKHLIINAIYDAIPDEKEWKILDGVIEKTTKYLKDLTRTDYGDGPAIRTKDGIYFTIIPGVPVKVPSLEAVAQMDLDHPSDDHYAVPLWYYYSHTIGKEKTKEGRFKSNEIVHVIGDHIKGPTLDELQRDLGNKAITHLMYL